MNIDRRALHELEASLGFTRRSVTGARIEVRAANDDGSGALHFDGYACITDHGYEMYGGPPYGWTEIIARGAFRKSLSERADVQLLINHEGEPLARTKSGTLELDEDDNGLHSVADLDPADPDVSRIATKMGRGDIDEMSFAFRVVRQRWEDEDGNEVDPYIAPVRRILEVNLNKGDVSIVNYGANDATFGSLRDLDHALAELRNGRTLDPTQRDLIRSWVDTTLVDPAPADPTAPAEPASTGRSLLAARTQAAPSRRTVVA